MSGFFHSSIYFPLNFVSIFFLKAEKLDRIQKYSTKMIKKMIECENISSKSQKFLKNRWKSRTSLSFIVKICWFFLLWLVFHEQISIHYTSIENLKIKNAWNMKELVVSILEIFTVAGFASCEQRISDTITVLKSRPIEVVNRIYNLRRPSFQADGILQDSLGNAKLIRIAQDYQSHQKLRDSLSQDKEHSFLLSDEELDEIVAKTQREITID